MIIRKQDNTYIIKILKNTMKHNDYFNKEKIKNLFQKIILKIKEKNNISGLLDINVYINENNIMLIEIEEIASYFEEIDMRIHFHLDALFLQEINQEELKKQKEVYYLNNKYYSLYQNTRDSAIIYKTEDILTKGIKII